MNRKQTITNFSHRFNIIWWRVKFKVCPFTGDQANVRPGVQTGLDLNKIGKHFLLGIQRGRINRMKEWETCKVYSCSNWDCQRTKNVEFTYSSSPKHKQTKFINTNWMSRMFDVIFNDKFISALASIFNSFWWASMMLHLAWIFFPIST